MDIHYFWQVFHTAPNDLFCPIAKKYCKQEGVYLSRTEHVVTIFCKSMIVVIRPFVWLFADTTAQVRLIVENWLPSLVRGLWSCLCNLSVTWVESTKGYNHWYGYSTGFRVVPCYWVKTDLQNLDLWSAMKIMSKVVLSLSDDCFAGCDFASLTLLHKGQLRCPEHYFFAKGHLGSSSGHHNPIYLS